jgi:hypothetical protein
VRDRGASADVPDCGCSRGTGSAATVSVCSGPGDAREGTRLVAGDVSTGDPCPTPIAQETRRTCDQVSP